MSTKRRKQTNKKPQTHPPKKNRIMSSRSIFEKRFLEGISGFFNNPEVPWNYSFL